MISEGRYSSAEKNTARSNTLAALAMAAIVTAALLAIFIPQWQQQSQHLACLDLSAEVQVCAVSDMAKPRDVQPVELEHPSFDLSLGQGLHLQAARNEVVAVQLILHSRSKPAANAAMVSVKDFVSFDDVGTVTSTFPSKANVKQFQAWYHPVRWGGYTFGADSDVLPWPGNYPDVLVPEFAGCGAPEKRVFEQISVNENAGGNAAVWLDVYVPSAQAPGDYQSSIELVLDSGETLSIPLQLTVWNARLPDKPSIEAIGELYRTYALEGATKDRTSPEWREMAHCYQRLAHQHRMVFMERWDDLVEFDWESHAQYAGPILDGSLFSAASGYVGPGQDTPVHIWRTPWEQDFDRHLLTDMTAEGLAEFEAMGRRWKQEVDRHKWHASHYFAYIFDEIDGPTDETGASDESESYLRGAHKAMFEVQEALDKGTEGPMIDLIWTSHSDPRFWQGKEGLDLAGTVRLWAPNASAAPSEYLQARKKLGESIWFYHDGHPTLGAHSINVSGIEMRSWGVIGARYDFDGQFMWAANLGQDHAPFREPTYRMDDDRFGNGVIVYPGNQLPKIGYPASPGPMPSMRMKAWRRGLQDAELAKLAKANGHQEAVDRLLRELVPVALADALDAGHKTAQWSQDPADWIEFRLRLLALASPQTALH